MQNDLLFLKLPIILMSTDNVSSRYYIESAYKAKKKNCYVALTRPKFENWVGRSIFFFTYRERVEFSNIFLKVSKWVKTRAECSQNAYTSAFLSHWIQILANSSPKSDIKKKKKKKKNPDLVFFAFYGRSGEGNIKKKNLGPKCQTCFT